MVQRGYKIGASKGATRPNVQPSHRTRCTCKSIVHLQIYNIQILMYAARYVVSIEVLVHILDMVHQIFVLSVKQ